MNDENSKPTPTGSEPGAAAADKEIHVAADTHETTAAQEITEAEQTHIIRINHTPKEYDPELDPNSPEFNEEKYAAHVLEARERLQAKLQELRNTIAESMGELYSPEALQESLKAMKTTISNAAAGIAQTMTTFRAFTESETWQNMKATMQYLIDNADTIRAFGDELEALEPYLEVELKKPEYGNATLEELLEAAETDEDESEGAEVITLFEKALEAARMAKLAADALPQLQSTGTPKYYTSPNTTLINALQANDGKGEVIGAGAIDLPVLSMGKPNEVTVYTIATLENMEGVTITGKPFTEYDRAVHDAVVTLYEDRIKQNQPPVMTADMIYRAMTHKTNTEKVSPQQKGAVTKSIDKMRKNISVYADASAEMQRRRVSINGKPVTEFKIDGFLLSADRITIKAGGETVEAYLLRGEPIMLNYAKLTGQLITVKGTMLDVKEIDSKGNITPVAIPNTVNRISVKSYLLRRVEVMRNDEKRAADALRKYESKRQKDPTLEPGNISKFRKQNHVILFDTLFNSTGIDSAKTQTAIKEYAYQVLDYWKASGDIKGYKKRKKGKAIDAVIIDL